MKASSLLLLLVAVIGFAAPAPTTNFTAHGTVQSLEAGTDIVNAFTADSVTTQSKGHEEYSFELYIHEYCNIDVKIEPLKPAFHVYAEFYHDDGHEYGWDFEGGLTKTFALDTAGDDISIRHDYDTSDTFFEYEDCKWRDGETKIRKCGVCDQSAPWEGPEGANQLDCAIDPHLYRHRNLVCSFWRKTKPGSVFVLPPGEDWKGTTSRDDLQGSFLVAPAADTTTVTTPKDIRIEAPVRNIQAVTPDDGIPDNLYRIYVSFSEYCDNGALKARGWMSNGQTRFELALNPTQRFPINLHPSLDLTFGPYSYDQHGFIVEYDGCKWTSEGGYPCGWCEMQPWSLGPLNCQTGQPGNQRLTYRTCYFVDNHMNGQVIGRDIKTKTSSSDSLKEVSAIGDSYSASSPSVNLTIDVFIDAPSDEFHENHLYYYFTMSFSEFCDNGALAVRGWWYDGNKHIEIKLTDKTWTYMRLHPPAPNKADTLVVGPYDFNEHSGSFQYGGCKWTSFGGFNCGLCEPHPWSMGPLNCETGVPGPQRFTYIDCKFMDPYDNIKIAGRDVKIPPTPSTPLEDVTFEFASATVTPQPELTTHVAGDIFNAQASTIVLMPAIIETTRPNAPHVPESQHQTDVILPFHLQIWEFCGLQGERLAAGVYTNGNMKQSLELRPGFMTSIKHWVPGYENLKIGPFGYKEISTVAKDYIQVPQWSS
ncbi:hypothetical protein BU25DRAFT_454083 [Macroventuria anomochaeta]|uniref:Uncharacterized protein n=1 Tax=Macroventuria anomochaeta TaxID=301207 RepID=A0ACB6SF69_9PLEO|nr:uncharacterized protein BU25DRAFT_454083 [Macroventuria anomochaeta]KAF2632915.1 hypothetical protein BU25DRAFT_454083 [Macroventuria anomochaeta]